MMYGVEFGKTHHDIVQMGEPREDPTPLAFAQCDCGVVVLTTPGNAGNEGECGACLWVREHPVFGPVAPPPGDSKLERASKMVLTILVLLVVGGLGYAVSTAPPRPNSSPDTFELS